MRLPLKPLYDDPLRLVLREAKAFRIQSGTLEDVVDVSRLKAAVPDTAPNEPCGPIRPAPPPPPSLHSAHPPPQTPVSPCPIPLTAASSSSSSSSCISLAATRAQVSS
ncbi:hypothetical protein SprV_0501796100 [Sparganum proliferum]